MLTPYEILTERLALKSANPLYAGLVYEYHSRNRDDLQTWLPIRHENYYTLERQVGILTTKAALFEADEEYRFLLFKRDDNEKVIGEFGFSNIIRGAFDSCFLGYQVDKNEHNNGYITEALEAGIKFIFSEKKLHRIEAHVMPRNMPSIKVLKKLGFEEEGYSKNYLKINGEWEDHLRFALLNHSAT